MILKICDLQKLNSVHLNVEITKFLKGQLQQKDKQTIQYMIKYSCLDVIPQMFLANKNKSNMLGSCILSFLETLIEAVDSQELQKRLRRYVMLGFHRKIFQNKDFS